MKRLTIALCGLWLATSSASAEPWGQGPRPILQSAAPASQISAAWDGGHGVIFAWQEDEGPNAGLLLTHHLLATGDLDPEWPAYGRVACGVPATRTELQLREDGVGGAYALWLEDRSLLLMHLEPDGAASPGWPERGRVLSTTASGADRSPGTAPRLITDGEGGVFVGWLEAGRRVLATRVGRDSRAAGGWPVSPMLINPEGGVRGLVYAPAFARGAGGGLLAAWYEVDWDGAVFGERRFRVRALRDAASGMPPEGVTLDAYVQEGDRDLGLLFMPRVAPAALLPVSAGGFRVFRWRTAPTSVSGGGGLVISEVAPDGEVRWDLAVGDSLRTFPFARRTARGARVELQAEPDGGFRLVSAGFEMISNIRFRPDRSPVYEYGFPYGLPTGSEAVVDLDVWGSSSMAAGIAPYSWSDSHHGDAARVTAVHRPGGGGRLEGVISGEGFSEDSEVGPYQYRSEKWFQSGTVRSTRDGGGMLIFSRLKRPMALMAERVGPVFGAVDAGSDPPRRVAPRLTHQRGAGVLVQGGMGESSELRVELYDLRGARVALGRGPATGAGWLVPGTRSLPSSVYFARLEWAGQQLTRRVVVLR